MNRIFKVVFNRVLGHHVVVSELARSFAKKSIKAVTAVVLAMLGTGAFTNTAMAQEDPTQASLKLNIDENGKYYIYQANSPVRYYISGAAGGGVMTESYEGKQTVIPATSDTGGSTEFKIMNVATGNTNPIGTMTINAGKNIAISKETEEYTTSNGTPGTREIAVISATHNKVTGGSATKASDTDNAVSLTLTDADNNTVPSIALENTYTTKVEIQNVEGGGKKAVFSRNDGNSYELLLSDLAGSSTDYRLVGANGETGDQASAYSVDANNKVTLKVRDTMDPEAPAENIVIEGVASTADVAAAKTEASKHTTVSVNDHTSAGNLTLTQTEATEQAGTNYDIQLSKNVDLTSEGSLTVGSTSVTGDTVTTTNVNSTNVTATTIKAGNTTINNNGMTIQNGPTITTTNVDMNNQQIHNVAAGTAAGDAVNYSQLKQTEANFDQKLNHLNGRIGEVAQDANAGIAMALAAASLPQAYLPGKSMMAVAGGTYRGEQGYAIGFSTVSDNGKWIIKANATGNSQGHYGAAVGAGYMW